MVAVQCRVQKSTQGSTPIFRTDWKTLKECAVCLENFFVRIAINAAHIYEHMKSKQTQNICYVKTMTNMQENNMK